MANIEVSKASEAAASAEPHQPMDKKAVGLLLALGIAAATQSGEGGELGALKDKLRGLAKDDPIDALMATVLSGGLLFYKLEHGKNPRVKTYWDAVLYVATSLSVGYNDCFPKTESGAALASLLHTFGPSLAANALSPPRAAQEAAAKAAAAKDAELLAVNKAILARLEDIATALKDR
jgi:voltage-gated potassium channel